MMNLRTPPVTAPIPDAHGLWIALLSEADARGTVSATGVSRSRDRAEAKCRFEMIERRHALTLSQRPLGMAAAADERAARARALLEMVERVSVRTWWKTGEAAQLSLTHAKEAQTYRATCQETPRAQTGVLDLTLPGLPSVVLAWSTDADGRDLCLGFGVAKTPKMAIRHAIRERCQMVFGLGLAQQRAARGHALTEQDRAILADTNSRNAGAVPLAPSRGANAPGDGDVAGALAQRGFPPNCEQVYDPVHQAWISVVTCRSLPWVEKDWPMYR